jgi:hypothetical protein
MLNAALEPRLPQDFAGIPDSTITPSKEGAPEAMEEPPDHRSERNRDEADFADMHTAQVDGNGVNADVVQQIIRQKVQISEQQLRVISLIALGVFTLLSAATVYMNSRLRHVEDELPDAITENAGECAEPMIAEKTAAAI